MSVPTRIFANATEIKPTEKGGFKGMLSLYGKKINETFVIEKGAYDKFHADEIKIPMLYSHDRHGDVLGHMYVKAVARGLSMRGKFNLNTEAGAKKWANFEAEDFNGFSVGADIYDGYADKAGLFHVTSLRATEGSYTPFPAQTDAVAVAASLGSGKIKISELTTEQRADVEKVLDSIVASLENGDVPAHVMDVLFAKEEPKETDKIEASAAKMAELVAALKESRISTNVDKEMKK